MFTGPSIPTGRGGFIFGAVAILAVVAAWLVFRPVSDPEEAALRAAPVFDRLVQLEEDGRSLEPSRLQVLGDTLFVSYNGLARLDAYSLELQLLRSIPLSAPETILPTAFTVTDTSIVVCDHGRGIVAVFDRSGRYQTSFGTLPDGLSRLGPIALTAYKGIAYVADMEQKRVLAISLNDLENITERGELVLSIPPLEQPPLGFPSAVQVTPDGRLLVGDALAAGVRVFTCDGQAIYAFDRIPGLARMAPQGFTYDTVTDPSLQKEDTWDPSGLPRQGRYHLLDGFNGVVHMFNPLGRYLGSYPEESRLEGPAGIAADRTGGRIFVSDTRRGRILVYRLKGG